MNRKKGSDIAWKRNNQIGRICLLRSTLDNMINNFDKNLLTIEEINNLRIAYHKLNGIYKNRESSWEKIKEENKSKQ